MSDDAVSRLLQSGEEERQCGKRKSERERSFLDAICVTSIRGLLAARLLQCIVCSLITRARSRRRHP